MSVTRTADRHDPDSPGPRTPRTPRTTRTGAERRTAADPDASDGSRPTRGKRSTASRTSRGRGASRTSPRRPRGTDATRATAARPRVTDAQHSGDGAAQAAQVLTRQGPGLPVEDAPATSDRRRGSRRSRIRRSPGGPSPRHRILLACTAALAAGFVAVLLLNTIISQGAFRQNELEIQLILLAEEEERLARAVQLAESPVEVEKAARKLGMVPAAAPVFLSLSDGKVLGEPVPAEREPGKVSFKGAPGVQPTPQPAPSPAASASGAPAVDPALDPSTGIDPPADAAAGAEGQVVPGAEADAGVQPAPEPTAGPEPGTPQQGVDQ